MSYHIEHWSHPGHILRPVPCTQPVLQFIPQPPYNGSQIPQYGSQIPQPPYNGSHIPQPPASFSSPAWLVQQTVNGTPPFAWPAHQSGGGGQIPVWPASSSSTAAPTQHSGSGGGWGKRLAVGNLLFGALGLLPNSDSILDFGSFF